MSSSSSSSDDTSGADVPSGVASAAVPPTQHPEREQENNTSSTRTGGTTRTVTAVFQIPRRTFHTEKTAQDNCNKHGLDYEPPRDGETYEERVLRLHEMYKATTRARSRSRQRGMKQNQGTRTKRTGTPARPPSNNSFQTDEAARKYCQQYGLRYMPPRECETAKQRSLRLQEMFNRVVVFKFKQQQNANKKRKELPATPAPPVDGTAAATAASAEKAGTDTMLLSKTDESEQSNCQKSPRGNETSEELEDRLLKNSRAVNYKRFQTWYSEKMRKQKEQNEMPSAATDEQAMVQAPTFSKDKSSSHSAPKHSDKETVDGEGAQSHHEANDTERKTSQSTPPVASETNTIHARHLLELTKFKRSSKKKRVV